MTNTFFTSDTHYNHKNIVLGVSNWEDQSSCRVFKTQEEHNEALIENINKTVKTDDILYHLGDWSFGGIDNIWEFRKQINCKNLHLILGNHDHHIFENRTLHANPQHLKAREIFSSVNVRLEKKICGIQMVLDHFPIHVWNNHFKGAWHLFGHCHGSFPHKELKKRKMMDVGVDTHPEFRPYHFDEIKPIMDGRIVVKIDHHDKSTRNTDIK